MIIYYIFLKTNRNVYVEIEFFLNTIKGLEEYYSLIKIINIPFDFKSNKNFTFFKYNDNLSIKLYSHFGVNKLLNNNYCILKNETHSNMSSVINFFEFNSSIYNEKFFIESFNKSVYNLNKKYISENNYFKIIYNEKNNEEYKNLKNFNYSYMLNDFLGSDSLNTNKMSFLSKPILTNLKYFENFHINEINNFNFRVNYFNSNIYNKKRLIVHLTPFLYDNIYFRTSNGLLINKNINYKNLIDYDLELPYLYNELFQCYDYICDYNKDYLTSDKYVNFEIIKLFLLDDVNINDIRFFKKKINFYIDNMYNLDKKLFNIKNNEFLKNLLNLKNNAKIINLNKIFI